MNKIRVLLADDQRLFVESLKRVIETSDVSIEVVATAADGQEAVELATQLQPDVILMDVRMPVKDGVQATKAIHDACPRIHIAMLTTFDEDEYVVKAIEYGAIGYLLKNISADSLVKAIRTVNEEAVLISPAIASRFLERVREGNIHQMGTEARGAAWTDVLSRREKEVLSCVAEGLRNKEIAERLFVSEQTVRNHVSAIYSKLGENNRYRVIEKATAYFKRFNST